MPLCASVVRLPNPTISATSAQAAPIEARRTLRLPRIRSFYRRDRRGKVIEGFGDFFLVAHVAEHVELPGREHGPPDGVGRLAAARGRHFVDVVLERQRDVLADHRRLVDEPELAALYELLYLVAAHAEQVQQRL